MNNNNSLYVILILFVTLLLIFGACTGGNIGMNDEVLMAFCFFGYPIMQLLCGSYLIYRNSKSTFGYILLISGIILLILIGACFAGI
jgi:hypothetical protein